MSPRPDFERPEQAATFWDEVQKLMNEHPESRCWFCYAPKAHRCAPMCHHLEAP